jgi:MFS family permease
MESAKNTPLLSEDHLERNSQVIDSSWDNTADGRPYAEMGEEEEELDGAAMKKLYPILLGVFLVNLNVSIIAPFFPVYALEHYGASSIVIALVFATYPLAGMLFAPVAGNLCNSFPRVTVLRAGLALNAFGIVMFGCAGFLKGDKNLVLATFFVARVVQGCGCAGVVVSASAFAAANFPRSLGKVIGMQMAAEGVGFMVGPPLGGALFAFGFPWPFITMATLAVLVAFGTGVQDEVKEEDEAKGEAHGFKQAMNWQVALAGAAAFAGTATVGFIDPVFAPHLKQMLNFGAQAAGGMFVIPPFFFGLFAEIGGGRTQTVGNKRVILEGLLMAAMGWVIGCSYCTVLILFSIDGSS